MTNLEIIREKLLAPSGFVDLAKAIISKLKRFLIL